MQQQNRHPRGREAVQRLEGFEQRGRVRLAAAGEERRQRIDDDEVELARGRGFDGPVDEVAPVFGRGSAAEGAREELGVRPDRHSPEAVGPMRLRFFGQNPGAGLARGPVQKGFAGAEALEQPGQEGGFAGLPEAREQGEIPRHQKPIPEPPARIRNGFGRHCIHRNRA